MLDIARELLRWWERGRPFAVATVVATDGSVPARSAALSLVVSVRVRSNSRTYGLAIA